METLIKRRERLRRRLKDFRSEGGKKSPAAQKVRKALNKIERKLSRGKTV